MIRLFQLEVDVIGMLRNCIVLSTYIDRILGVPLIQTLDELFAESGVIKI